MNRTSLPATARTIALGLAAAAIGLSVFGASAVTAHAAPASTHCSSSRGVASGPICLNPQPLPPGMMPV